MLIAVRYAEIGLKGKNRCFFERLLVENIKNSIKCSVKSPQGRILIETEDQSALDKLKYIFGISSFSKYEKVPAEIEKIQQKALEIVEKEEFSSFKVETQRLNKDFPIKSPEINSAVGNFICEKTGKKAEMKNPELVLYIEIFNNDAFVFTHFEKGLGGLPVGVSGKVLSLLSGGIDSPVSSLLMMKRGCSVDFVHFHNFPYVSKSSIEKVKELFAILKKYSPKSKLYLIPLTDVQKEIVAKCPQQLRIILYRRMMVRITEALMEKTNYNRNHQLISEQTTRSWVVYKAIVSGESLGQVASQTIENMIVISSVTKRLFLRPLVGMDKLEIIELAKKYGTYETSIIPHEDCCTFFAPRQPETRSTITEVEEAEKAIDVNKMVEKCVKLVEIVK